MKAFLLSMILLLPFCMVNAQSVYLKKLRNGHLKKLKRKTILNFRTGSTWVTGRIISATDSTLAISTYKPTRQSDTVHVPIKSIRYITNELVNSPGPALMSGYMLVGAVMGTVLIPVAWIDEGKQAALDGVHFLGSLVGMSGVISSPYLIQRRFNTRHRWAIVLK